MSTEPVSMGINQNQKMWLPEGHVLRLAGIGNVLHGMDGKSRIRLRDEAQTIGPFDERTFCEIQSLSGAWWQSFNLNGISQEDLEILDTLPVGTEAAVLTGNTLTSKYWNGVAWVMYASDEYRVTQNETPQEGDHIVIQSLTSDVLLVLKGNIHLNELTISLPGAEGRDSQIVRIVCRVNVENLILNGNPVDNYSPQEMAWGDSMTLVKIEPQLWSVVTI